MLMSPHVEEVAALLAEEKVPVITTGAGNPSKYMKSWLAAGIRVIPVVASVAMARLVAGRARRRSSPRAANRAAMWAS